MNDELTKASNEWYEAEKKFQELKDKFRVPNKNGMDSICSTVNELKQLDKAGRESSEKRKNFFKLYYKKRFGFSDEEIQKTWAGKI